MSLGQGTTNRVNVIGERSTKLAADVLASETRAFGNASAKLSLQMATEAFLRAKAALQQRLAENDKAT